MNMSCTRHVMFFALSGLVILNVAATGLPAADLELTAAVRLVRGFGLTIGGGPVAHLLDGALHMGWSAAGGLFWQG